MYDTKEALLAVLEPDAADKVAQRAMKLIDETRRLARDVIIKDEENLLEPVTELYFLIGVPLLAAHHVKDYKFICFWKEAEAKAAPGEANPFTMLPIMVKIPDLDEAVGIIDMCESNYESLRKLVPQARLN